MPYTAVHEAFTCAAAVGNAIGSRVVAESGRGSAWGPAHLVVPLGAQPTLQRREQGLAHHVVVRGQHAVRHVPLAQALRACTAVLS
eukprot:scaffold45105_cov67-Phaeocystis_antarctica.AAC.7